MGYKITDNINDLKAILPLHLISAIEAHGNQEKLIEIIMDLGRQPTARYTTGEIVLDEQEIEHQHIEYVTSRMRDFDTDNRAGIERTLHRISAIRNRQGDVVGLTCRIGRAVYGTIDIIKDIVQSGKSVLLLGPPGVGKTTMLRESARVLADSKRVVIVDTSNEIGGDGDVPHPAVGRARRMQVAQPTYQHEVMIEAVENHNPEVIVIDEIGRELEAQAARTIAERGVQLIGTAHGNTLENLLMNPILSDLVGGIESVTLSDDEARRRRTQKTVLERRSPPTFDVLIELQDRDRLIIHDDVATAVDAHLRQVPLAVESRFRDNSGSIRTETLLPQYADTKGSRLDTHFGNDFGNSGGRGNGKRRRRERNSNNTEHDIYNEPKTDQRISEAQDGQEPHQARRKLKVIKAYPYGVARNRLAQSARRLNVPLVIVDEMEDANLVVTLKNYYRRRPRLIVDAERRGTSVFVLRANTVTQMEDFIFDVFKLEQQDGDPASEALKEAEDAIEQVQTGEQSVDLRPQPNHLRRRQHDLARQAHLVSHSYGAEPHRYVRIMNPHIHN